MKRFLFVVPFCLIVFACSNRETILVDGSVQSRQQLDKFDSSEIFSYSRWLPGKAPSWYQKWNKTTLIVVKTKKKERKLQEERHVLLNHLLDSVDKGADILIVQDGILILPLSQKDLRKLSPEQLSNAETIDWQVSKTIYGSSARPISLIIDTYNYKYSYIP